MKKLEIEVFEREKREFEMESKQKELGNAILQMQKLMMEKECELNRLREDAHRKERTLIAEIDRIASKEEVIDSENNVLQFCVNGLNAKVDNLKARREEILQVENVLREKLKFEGKMELEFAGLEFN